MDPSFYFMSLIIGLGAHAMMVRLQWRSIKTGVITGMFISTLFLLSGFIWGKASFDLLFIIVTIFAGILGGLLRPIYWKKKN